MMKTKAVKFQNSRESMPTGQVDVIQTMSKITRALLIVTVCFLLKLTTVSSQGYGLSDSTIQVMKHKVHTTDNDTLRLQSAIRLSLYYVTTQIDSARQYFQASYEACTDLNYPLGMAWSSSLAGFSYYFLGDYKSAYQWINLSKSHFGQIEENNEDPIFDIMNICLLYTSPSPRDRTRSRMPSSA